MQSASITHDSTIITPKCIFQNSPVCTSTWNIWIYGWKLLIFWHFWPKMSKNYLHADTERLKICLKVLKRQFHHFYIIFTPIEEQIPYLWVSGLYGMGHYKSEFWEFGATLGLLIIFWWFISWKKEDLSTKMILGQLNLTKIHIISEQQ